MWEKGNQGDGRSTLSRLPNILERPYPAFSRPGQDYGPGFYCTKDLNLAKEWASSASDVGYVNCYDLDTEGLQILCLNDPDHTILNWLAVLVANRDVNDRGGLVKEAKEYILSNFSVDIIRYDIIIGYRADDSYFSYTRDFLNGAISIAQLKNAMSLGDLGFQMVLKTPKALSRIRFTKYIEVESSWYRKRMERDTRARRKYLDRGEYRRQPGDIYITQIIDERMTADDPRLR